MATRDPEKPASSESREATLLDDRLVTERRESALGLPEDVGPYKILGHLGYGGMGTVYRAEQLSPVRREVALKVIHSGLFGSQGQARFEVERQAMARLQHPNVAQIFDAGSTADGQPYFAMELVDGEPITVYCDRKQLSIEDRLQLYRRVCEGVQHAHQKGILHRDVKPTNVLVTEIDGRPVPKVIDFGIAKAIDQPLVEATPMTGDRLIGTPAYLSPEAALIGETDLDLDTRSDVYSLGILLYELLAGRRPFSETGGNVLKVLRQIVEDEPRSIQARWEQLDSEQRAEIASERGLEPEALGRRLRGDLQWIVAKAIAKDREERYGSATELADDLGRHLRYEPVSANPPSVVYRLRKFVRRRSGTVAAILLVTLAVTLGYAARSIEAQRANREAAAANEARQAMEAALVEAENARSETEQLSDFLKGLFNVSDPGQGKGNVVTARELLDEAARAIETDLADQPLARARFQQTIGDIYRKLGLYQPAQNLIELALAIRQQELPEDHLDLAESFNGLGVLHAQLGDFEASRPLFVRTLEIREEALEPDDPKIAASLNNLANLYSDTGRFDLAEPLYLRSVEIANRYQGELPPDLLVGLNNLAVSYFEEGRYDEAEPLFLSFLERQQAAHGLDHPHVAVARLNLGEVRWALGEMASAEEQYRSAMEILDRVLGPQHPDTAYSVASLAGLLAARGTRQEAEELYRRALAVQEVTLELDHPERQETIDGFANLLVEQGRQAEAEALRR